MFEALLLTKTPEGTTKLRWTKSEGGAGAQTITEGDASKGMKYTLEIGGGKFVVQGRVLFTRIGSQTAVEWIDDMDFAHSYSGRYFGTMMDKMLGPKIEKSLLTLKARSEDRARGGSVAAMPKPQAVAAPAGEKPMQPAEPAPVQVEVKPTPGTGAVAPEPEPAPPTPTPAPEAPAPAPAPVPVPAPAPTAAPGPEEKPAETP